MSELVNRTFSIDKHKHRDFKIECTRQGVDMSETIESFMVSFTKVSREQRAKSNEE